MNTHSNKTTSTKNQSIGNEVAQKKNDQSTFQFVDNRSETQEQRKLQAVMNNSSQVKQLQAFQKMANDHASQQYQPVQKVGDGIREGDVSELSEEEVLKHLTNSFKKGKIEKPLINQSGNVVQRQPEKESYGGGDLFKVKKSDLGTGTGTSKGTRAHVNDSSTPKPDSILFDYATAKSTKISSQVVKGNKLAYEVDNPEADDSYKSGSYWDAGHKLGRQNGGLGNNNDWVFPQNPAFNQGNSRNMDDVEETNPLWRAHEDAFHEGVKSDGAGIWWLRLL